MQHLVFSPENISRMKQKLMKQNEGDEFAMSLIERTFNSDTPMCRYSIYPYSELSELCSIEGTSLGAATRTVKDTIMWIDPELPFSLNIKMLAAHNRLNSGLRLKLRQVNCLYSFLSHAVKHSVGPYRCNILFWCCVISTFYDNGAVTFTNEDTKDMYVDHNLLTDMKYLMTAMPISLGLDPATGLKVRDRKLWNDMVAKYPDFKIITSSLVTELAVNEFPEHSIAKEWLKRRRSNGPVFWTVVVTSLMAYILFVAKLLGVF